MRETLELRIPEENALRFLRGDEGRVMGSAWEIELVGPFVRQLFIDMASTRCAELRQITQRMWGSEKKFFHHGWDIKRYYSTRELQTAEVFHLHISPCFEPPGELCGTVFDDSTSCNLCGAGRTQVSDLRLDLRKAPKTKDIAHTIADEWVVSQRLAEIITDAQLTGCELRPVRHKARYEDDPYIMEKYSSGRELLGRARELRLEPPSWSFYVWLNRSEQSELLTRVQAEVVADKERRFKNRGDKLPVWYQLIITSNIEVGASTRFGMGPFEEEDHEGNVCPLGHVLGLNLLSELYVLRDSWSGTDFAATRQLVGCRRGVLVPRPMFLISPKVRSLFVQHKVRGFKTEVAHLL